MHKAYPIRSWLIAILLSAALVIIGVSLSVNIYLNRSHVNTVYSQLSEYLNLYTELFDTKFAAIEQLSFDILSDASLQSSLQEYDAANDLYSKYLANSSIYTKLFSRLYNMPDILSISFTLSDQTKINADRQQALAINPVQYANIVEEAYRLDGDCGWQIDNGNNNTVYLYRLIRDTSGGAFRPFGVLIIHMNVSSLMRPSTSTTLGAKAHLFCLSDGNVLTSNPGVFDDTEINQLLNLSGAYHLISIGDTEYFVTERRSAYTRWRFFHVLPGDQVQSYFDVTNRIQYLALSLTFLIVIALGVLLSNQISLQVRHLIRAMNEAGKGDFKTTPLQLTLLRGFSISELNKLLEHFRHMMRDIDNLINEGFKRQLIISEMKYKMLQQQINPHFLYNTLDTINWKATGAGQNEIAQMVCSLSKLLRRSISGPDMITIGEDLQFIADYMMIQKIRFEERLHFNNFIEPRVYPCQIPKLSLQPIVENSIVHNLEKHSASCVITLESAVHDDYVEILLSDNGSGVDPLEIEAIMCGEKQGSHTSIGLRNIHERIQLAFGEAYGVHVTNRQEGGTTVAIRLPHCEEVKA